MSKHGSSPASKQDFRQSYSSGSSQSVLEKLARTKLQQMRARRNASSVEQVRGYLPHPPSARQRVFLELVEAEALFGGAAGGGKSDALLMGALQYVHVPGYAAIIFRRTFTDLALPGAIMDRAYDWWSGTAAKWESDTKTWVFPTGKDEDGRPTPPATITFAYLQHESDKERYKSAEFQYVGFDELTDFSETQYTFLFSRLRKKKGMPVPLRMRSASNPGGAGHEWVKRRFVEHSVETRAANDNSEATYLLNPPSDQAKAVAELLGTQPQGAAFVRALLTDNPGLDVPSYRAQLAQLDPITRRRMEEGDWDVGLAGEFFEEGWFQYLDEEPDGVAWMRYWDMAGTKPHAGNPDPDWTAGVRIGLHREQATTLAPGETSVAVRTRIVIADVRRTREDPGGVEDFIRTAAQQDGRRVRIRMEQEPGSSGKTVVHDYVTRVLQGYDVDGDKKTADKATMWKPLSSQAKHGNLYLVRAPWNADFVRELCSLPYGKKDQTDAAAGGLALITGGSAAERLRAAAAAGM